MSVRDFLRLYAASALLGGLAFWPAACASRDFASKAGRGRTGVQGSELRGSETPAARAPEALSQRVNTAPHTAEKPAAMVGTSGLVRSVAGGKPPVAWRERPGPIAQGVHSFRGGAAWKDTQRLALAGTRSPEPALVIAGIKPGHHLEALARSAASLCGVDPDLFWSLVMRESSGRHWDKRGRVLRSSAGAIGLGQIKESTARDVSPTLDVMQPWGNAVASSCHLRKLIDRRRGDVRAALRDYHAGAWRRATSPATVAYAEQVMEGSAQ